MTSAQLQAHLQRSHYGPFQLTDAVRPAPERGVVPRQGYRVGLFEDRAAGLAVPVLAAAASRPVLFEAFLALLDPLGEVVDVVLETSHGRAGQAHRDLFREHIDRPVLESYLCDFEDVLLHDGCAGLAVLSTTGPMEVQFDEHKTLVVYARDVSPFAAILRECGVGPEEGLRLVSEGEHLHRTQPAYREQFEQLCYRLGVGAAAERVNW